MAQNSPLASVASGGDDGTFITPRPDVTAELVALADRDLLTAGRKAYSPDPALHDPLVGRLKALAGMGRLQEASDHLLTIIARDRGWNDDAARKQLLTVFEAAGPASETAKQGRRRLSAILFS